MPELPPEVARRRTFAIIAHPDAGINVIFLRTGLPTFTPAAIAGKARELGFSSDSSYRFERGVDYALPRAAIERATRLILDICGG